ncbi:MAG: hypothetical protein ABGX07_04415, partial [Pirellulaceae bacterium]
PEGEQNDFHDLIRVVFELPAAIIWYLAAYQAAQGLVENETKSNSEHRTEVQKYRSTEVQKDRRTATQDRVPALSSVHSKRYKEQAKRKDPSWSDRPY